MESPAQRLQLSELAEGRERPLIAGCGPRTAQARGRLNTPLPTPAPTGPDGSGPVRGPHRATTSGIVGRVESSLKRTPAATNALNLALGNPAPRCWISSCARRPDVPWLPAQCNALDGNVDAEDLGPERKFGVVFDHGVSPPPLPGPAVAADRDFLDQLVEPRRAQLDRPMRPLRMVALGVSMGPIAGRAVFPDRQPRCRPRRSGRQQLTGFPRCAATAPPSFPGVGLRVGRRSCAG